MLIFLKISLKVLNENHINKHEELNDEINQQVQDIK